VNARAVVGTEFYKAGRRLRTYIAYSIVAGIPLLVTALLKLNPPDITSEGPRLAFLSTQSGLMLAAFALFMTSELLLLVIVVALFPGDAIAGEASWGNLRYLLMRPVTRGRLFAAKLVSAVFYAWVGVALVTTVGAIAGGLAFGFGGISVPGVPIFGFEDGLSLSTSDLVLYLFIASVYVAWMLMSVLTFSFLIGCVTDSPGGAVLAGAGLWITMTILDEIESVGSVRNLLPSHYSGNWRWMFTDDRVSPDLWRGSLLTLGYVIVFVAIASWWFRRKDILS
jgi:ABC-2 type transport system permease protein